MSVQTANSDFAFHLPSLSYIDAKWEEPNLRTPAAVPQTQRKTGLARWLSYQVATFLAWRRDRVALAELVSMSDHELMDIGMTRSDLARAFDPAWNQDLRQRGATKR